MAAGAEQNGKARNLKKCLFTIYMLRAINGVIAVSAMQQDVKFEVLKRCCIQIYPAIFLLFYEKIIGLQHIVKFRGE